MNHSGVHKGWLAQEIFYPQRQIFSSYMVSELDAISGIKGK
jgi:uncharacterized NAD(P)/FAD-binding protein YdhS